MDHKRIFKSVVLIKILLANDNFIHIITTWSMRKPSLVAHLGVCMLTIAHESLNDSHFNGPKNGAKPNNQHNLECLSGHQLREMAEISTLASCESNPMFGRCINEHKGTENNSKFRRMSYQSWELSSKLSTLHTYMHVYVDLIIRQYSLCWMHEGGQFHHA